MAGLVPNRGNYRQLLCYRKAEAIYDITYHFVMHFVEHGDRTRDQMVQAARSGKQNIAEGYAAGATSKETELKLLNVAKSSLNELLEDYLDYLRTRRLRRWEESSVEMKRAQELGKEHNDTEFWMSIVENRGDETVANIAIVLLYQADYLIYKYIQSVEARFLEQGGFREKLSTERRRVRGQK